jgi:hypothetical protein
MRSYVMTEFTARPHEEPPLSDRQNGPQGFLIPQPRSLRRARTLAWIMAVLVAAVFLYSLNDDRGSPKMGRILLQEGTVTIPGEGNGVVEVRYQVPYETPPDLTLTKTLGQDVGNTILDSKADHFKLKTTLQGPLKVRWKAEGRPKR